MLWSTSVDLLIVLFCTSLGTSAQNTTNSGQACSKIAPSDLEILLQETLFEGFGVGGEVTVVDELHRTCQVEGSTIGTYEQLSLVVNYIVDNDTSNPRVIQIELDCSGVNDLEWELRSTEVLPRNSNFTFYTNLDTLNCSDCDANAGNDNHCKNDYSSDLSIGEIIGITIGVIGTIGLKFLFLCCCTCQYYCAIHYKTKVSSIHTSEVQKTTKSTHDNDYTTREMSKSMHNDANDMQCCETQQETSRSADSLNKNDVPQHYQMSKSLSVSTVEIKEDGVSIKARSDYSRLYEVIEHSDLKVIETIGQGEFGVVYRGVLTVVDSTDETTIKSVAVKALRSGNYSDSQTDELLKEAEKMKFFNHINVLSLIGVCVGLKEAGTNSLCIVMPFMSNGSLLSFLRKEAPNLTLHKLADENLVLETCKHLLSMCLQVAKGMEYLAEQKFIHRDLAARNCMMSAKGIIKVADFGLAEDIYTSEYFKLTEGTGNKLPVKWMALESIHLGKFSEKTDVWSFGVLCWEVFSLGRIPYPGLDPIRVVRLLDNGNRLDQPSNVACNENIYSFMLSCWEESADKRPAFSNIVKQLEKMIAPLANYMEFDFNAYKTDQISAESV